MKMLKKILLLLIVILVLSCGAGKKNKINIKTVTETESKAKIKVSAQLEETKSRESEILDQSESKTKAETTETIIEKETKVKVRPQIDPISGKIKPFIYEEKENGKVTKGIYVNGDGEIEVNTKEKTSHINSENHKVDKVLVNLEIKDTHAKKADSKFEVNAKAKSILEYRVLKKEKTWYYFSFMTYVWFFIILILCIILWWCNKKFGIFNKIAFLGLKKIK